MAASRAVGPGYAPDDPGDGPAQSGLSGRFHAADGAYPRDESGEDRTARLQPAAVRLSADGRRSARRRSATVTAVCWIWPP